MKLKHLLFIMTFVIAFVSVTPAQETEKEQKFGINFGGFVKNDIFYDTRQTVSAREGHFNLFPSGIDRDETGKDVNATPNFNMLAIQTRLTGRITGPDAFGAKTSGVIEGAFFGHTNADINGFRLRHAFVKFNWENAELISGQYWHPLFIVQAFPEVISFNTGVPFQPFSRNPQLRYSYKINNLNLIATAYTLRDFSATGPAGVKTTIQRNAGMPNFNFTLTYSPKESKSIFGAGVDYKTLSPRMFSEVVVSSATTAIDTSTWNVISIPAKVEKFKVDEKLSSISATAFAKIVADNITLKLQGVYAQNAHDIMGIGGYAVLLDSYDFFTGEQEYTNLNTGSVWTELYYTADKFVAGVFAGYTLNLGSDDKMENIKFGRGTNIEYIYRIAPRIAFTQGKATIGFELEYTTAAYADDVIDEMGKFSSSEEITNIRALLSFIYSF